MNARVLTMEQQVGGVFVLLGTVVATATVS